MIRTIPQLVRANVQSLLDNTTRDSAIITESWPGSTESNFQFGLSFKHIIRLLRPRQWTKNLIAITPALFAGVMFKLQAIVPVLWCIVALCLASSAVYILNDIRDIALDRLHPTKQHRPLAAGQIAPFTAWILCFVLAIAAVSIALIINKPLALVIACYCALNVAYSFRLKNIAIADIFCIAAGFVLRAIAGAVAASVATSGWFLLCTAFGALFLSVEKRHQEIRGLNDIASAHRASLQHYTADMLKQFQIIIVPGMLMSYSLYSFFSPYGQAMLATVPFVLFGIMRYQLIANSTSLAETPEEVLLTDTPLQACIGLWVVTSMAVIYFLKVLA